jgi:cation:H+ antiporter
VLLTLRFPRWLAFTLLGLFAVQYAVPGQAGRYILVIIYAAIALAALARNRRFIWPALTAPFRNGPEPAAPDGPEPERAAAQVRPAERVHAGIE